MTTSVNISFFSSAERAASTASKKDYRSTAYNNYSADLVDLDNEVCTIEVEASSESEATDKAERIAFEMGIQVSYINIYKG
ncbi:MAG: hypothetical protein IKX31_02110 [Muribaculaceae bacterium]|nr:hypothetical protein [Muribaculaceae bacterium]